LAEENGGGPPVISPVERKCCQRWLELITGLFDGSGELLGCLNAVGSDIDVAPPQRDSDLHWVDP
jgi:hypothetical protein